MIQLDKSDVLRIVLSSEANLPLAAERLSTRSGTQVTEYEILEQLTQDITLANEMSAGLRTLMTVKMFDMLMTLQQTLLGKVDELDVKDAARTYTALITAFNAMTTPATKVTFDFGLEVAKLAQELELDVKDVESELKAILSANKK